MAANYSLSGYPSLPPPFHSWLRYIKQHTYTINEFTAKTARLTTLAHRRRRRLHHTRAFHQSVIWNYLITSLNRMRNPIEWTMATFDAFMILLEHWKRYTLMLVHYELAHNQYTTWWMFIDAIGKKFQIKKVASEVDVRWSAREQINQ